MRLSIIIVNYKTPQLINNCIRSMGDIDKSHTEVIVVDNNSEDDSEEKIMSVFPFVKWIQMNYNAGFARANNRGLRASCGNVVLLLNSDTLDVDNAIQKTLKCFLDSPYIAAGVQLLNEDGTPQISGNFFMPGSLNNLLPLPYTGVFVKFLGTTLRVHKPHIENATSVQEVDWINGAFLMVKKDAIISAGMLDEDFFLYAEEAEWCARLRKVGKLVIFGQFKVIHLQGQTSGSAFNSASKGYYNLYDRKGLQIALSNFVRIRKQFGIGWFLFHLVVYSATVPIFFAAEMIRRLAHKKNPYGGTGLQFLRTVAGLWSYAPRIVINRPYFYKVL